MKKYIRTATDRSNKATQTVSKKFSEEEIAEKAENGYRKGESMQQIFKNIMNDPDVEIGEADEEGNSTLFFKGENVGWINFRRGMGSINNKKYTEIKHAAKARANYSESEDEIEE